MLPASLNLPSNVSFTPVYLIKKKKQMTSYNKQRPPREATRGDGVLSKDEQGVYKARHSSFKCRDATESTA